MVLISSDHTADSTESEDDNMETAQLEQMVAKLTRIVKHVVPGSTVIKEDEHVDKNTSNWLNSGHCLE